MKRKIYNHSSLMAALSRKLAVSAGTPNRVMANFNGSNGATTTTDNVAGTSHTLVDATLTTAVKKFGTASLTSTGILSGGDTITFPEQSNISACTVSFWLRYADVNPDVEALVVSLSHSINATVSIYSTLYLVNTASWTVDFYGTVGGNSSPSTPPLTFLPDTWYHVAFVQDGNAIAGYFDGVRQFATTLDGGSTLLRPYNQLLLTNDGGVGSFWIDDVRVINSALYTGASYTVPSSEQT